jgi:hypothetical protein
LKAHLLANDLPQRVVLFLQRSSQPAGETFACPASLF